MIKTFSSSNMMKSFICPNMMKTFSNPIMMKTFICTNMINSLFQYPRVIP